MISFFINRATTESRENTLRFESFSFYTLYLFAETSAYYCNLSYYINLWNSRDEWGDTFSLQLDWILKAEDDIREVPLENTLENYKILKKVKARKHKSKEYLIFINRFNNLIQQSKQIALLSLKILFGDSGFLEWIDLFDDETAIALAFRRSESINENEEDDVITILMEAFLVPDGILFLHFYINRVFKPIAIDKADKLLPEDEAGGFYQFPLVSFPLCDNLEIEKMKALRASMQAKIKNISGMMDGFTKEVETEEFNEVLKEKCSLFYKRLLPEIEILQKHIDN